MAFPTRPPSVADPSPPRVSFLQAFIASFGDRTGATVDAEADSRRIQEFLRATESAFRGHPAWRGASEGDLEASGEGLEKYLMTKLHPSTFAVTPDDQRADSLLSRRVAALRTFIRPEHLDIPERFRVEASLRLAEDELVKVNLFKAPRDKLVCVLNTCRIVTNLLSVSSGNKPAGADDFLPVLIYVVLRANPPRLESNLRFISRFRRESRLASEAAYFYTNLVSATHFLSSCDHAAFTDLDADVFEAHMAAEGFDVNEGSNGEEGNEGDSNAAAGSRSAAAALDAARRERAELQRELEASRRLVADLEAAAARPKPPLRWGGVEDVEAEGAAALEAEEAERTLRLPYKFAYARSDDLQIGDVPDLLAGYKSLLLRYEALARGVGVVLASSDSRDDAGVSNGGGGGDAAPAREQMITVVSPLEGSKAAPADVDGLGTFADVAPAAATPPPTGPEDPFAQLGVGGGDAGGLGSDSFTDPFKF